MNESEYLENRLCDQIRWYSRKSRCYKKYFYVARTIEIIFASALTALSCIPYFQASILIPFLSFSIVIIASLLALYKFQELWVSYRTTSESLKHEKYLFETKTVPYHKENRFNLLVENIETMISTENSMWKQKFYFKEK